ncbi:MAG TPA: PhzF family phenazine biosynthesis protein [Pseudonocardiaceae bacterium]|nr:PhzF family phenazine biosynthesis protein [Pseudonocardiaceae bacterium]
MQRSRKTDEANVPALAPDFTALVHLTRRDGIRGIIVTAPAAEPSSGYDFVSRFFAPTVGIPEDPVTGSAHTALAPCLVTAPGRDSLTGLQISARTGLVSTTCTSPGMPSSSSTAPFITAPDTRTSRSWELSIPRGCWLPAQVCAVWSRRRITSMTRSPSDSR